MTAKRKKNLSPLNQFVKKSSLISLILFLVFFLFELVDHAEFSHETKIPGVSSPIELYSNQTKDDLGQLYQQAISNAQSSLFLVIYALTDDSIINALQKKCEAGVPVHIVCDAKASRGISKRLPGAVIIKRLGDGLMHQKILIIDNHQIWLGSANLTPSSLNIHGNLVMGLDHPALANALVDRIKSMDDENGVTPLLHQETTAGNQNIELWMLPDDPDAVKKMIELFRAAKKSIQVAMFTWTRTDFTQELIAAKKRGVKVEVVLDRYAGKGTSAKIANMLKEGGIPVRLSTGQGLLHHKFAYIDKNIVVNGSANWTKAAFENNDDCFVVIHSLTDTQRDKMEQLYAVIKKQSE